MTLLLSLLLAVPPASAAGAAKAPDAPLETLRPGGYSAELKGMLCTACAETIRRQLSAIDGVDKVAIDFDARRLTFVVLEGRKIAVSVFRKALRRAAEKADLGTEFSLEKLRYSA